jgi:orotidine-5'-phosphate decarboxylase
MTEPSKAKTPALKTKDRIIVALDVETADEARAMIAELRGEAGAFKIGLQLFTAAGPSFVREVTASGVKVFLDLKFHDIPHTVAAASVEAARLGVWMFNVHASGGREMMARAFDAVRRSCEVEGREMPVIIGVTLLTSWNAATLGEAGIESSVEEYVVRLAREVEASGLAGVVASPIEASAIRKAVVSDGFVIVTPGIRTISGTLDDQKRVTTPADALSAGADYLVIGRPIIAAPDHAAAVRKIIADIDKAN